MDKLFEKKRLEWTKTLNPRENFSNEKNALLLRSSEDLPKVGNRTQLANARGVKQQHTRPSVVDNLCNRAALEGSETSIRRQHQPVPDGLPHDERATGVLKRIRPDHNDHLRRSTRTSSGSRLAFDDGFSYLEDVPTVKKFSKTHDLGETWKKPMTYPKIGKKKTTVEFTDIERLDEGEYLNDNLLSFYLRFLEHTLEERKPDLAKRVYFFNTFFFATLMNTHQGKKGFNYERVQKWTRNVDLFTYDYIVVPINEAAHWYLAIVCNLPALDRSLPLSELDQSNTRFTTPSKDCAEIHASSSSPEYGLPEHDSVSLIDGYMEPEEKSARRSFAELSLDADERPPSNGARSTSFPAISMDEDQEMLDGQLVQATDGSPQVLSAEGVAIQSGHDAQNLQLDQDHGRKSAGKSKRGKRKSGPPAITKTPPDKPVIITFDSLGMARSPTVKILKDYLREEAKAKRGGMEFEAGQIKGITASQIPQQDNFYDCGVFLLGYVAKFLEEDPRDFITKIIRREYHVIEDWPNLRPSVLRTAIRDEVLRLHEEQDLERRLERDARKDSKEAMQSQRSGNPSPTHKLDQPDQSPRNIGREEDVEAGEPQEAISPAAPGSRRHALDNALSLPLSHDNDDAERSKITSESEEHFEARSRYSNLDSKRQDTTSQPPSPHANDLGKPKEYSTSSAEERHPVIFIDSQSQPDASAPRSFYQAHANQAQGISNDGKTDLPAEIQDSQPSQTSRAFADLVRKTAHEEEDASLKEREVPQDIPVVRLEEQKSSKRKKSDSEAEITVTERSGRLTKPAHELSDRDCGLPNWFSEGPTPYKRRKYRRKSHAMKDDEIINIDD